MGTLQSASRATIAFALTLPLIYVLVKSSTTGQQLTTPTPSAVPTPNSGPTNLSATAVSSSAIDLSWTAATGSVAGYKIFRNGIQEATITGTGTTYHDTELAPSITYTDTVIATYTTGGASQPSNNAS